MTVAREFGFSEQRISRALQSKTFKNAGELVQYLEEDEDDEIDTLTDDMKRILTVKENVESVSTVASEAMDEDKETSLLMKETLILYGHLYCLRCRDRKRSIITLPCCHFTMCRVCSYTAEFCPKRSCREEVKDLISVYM